MHKQPLILISCRGVQMKQFALAKVLNISHIVLGVMCIALTASLPCYAKKHFEGAHGRPPSYWGGPRGNYGKHHGKPSKEFHKEFRSHFSPMTSNRNPRTSEHWNDVWDKHDKKPKHRPDYRPHRPPRPPKEWRPGWEQGFHDGWRQEHRPPVPDNRRPHLTWGNGGRPPHGGNKVPNHPPGQSWHNPRPPAIVTIRPRPDDRFSHSLPPPPPPPAGWVLPLDAGKLGYVQVPIFMPPAPSFDAHFFAPLNIPLNGGVNAIISAPIQMGPVNGQIYANIH